MTVRISILNVKTPKVPLRNVKFNLKMKSIVIQSDGGQ